MLSAVAALKYRDGHNNNAPDTIANIPTGLFKCTLKCTRLFNML